MDAAVVVIGGGYAGSAAITELQSLDVDFDITWISKDPFHTVRHELHRLIRHPELTEALTVPVDRIRANKTEFLESTVTEIDPSTQQLTLANETRIPYDYLLLTTGCRPAYYGIPGLEKHADTIGTVEQAVTMHKAVGEAFRSASREEPARVVIGGGGLTGVQIAGEVAQWATRESIPAEITVIEALESVLPAAAPVLRERVQALLQRAGVSIRVASPIVEATDEHVILDGEEVLPYDALIWTGGITAHEFVTAAGLEMNRHRVTTDETLQTSDDRVYAAGDIAWVEQDGLAPPPTAQAAWQAGPVAARNLIAAARGQRPERWHYRDKGTLVSVGDATIAYDILGIPVQAFGGPPARFLKRFVAVRWIASLTSYREAIRAWRYL